MNKINKKQLLIGALILLFAVNLAALGTIIYHNYQNRQVETPLQSNPGDVRAPRYEPNRPRAERQMAPRDGRGRGRRFDSFIQTRLNLNEQQFARYRNLMDQTRREQRSIIREMDEKRDRMMQELTKNNPDEQQLDSLALEIGELHGQLKRNTIQHFRTLKSICEPHQQEALNQMILEMSQTGRHQPGPQRRPNRRHIPRN